MILANAFPDSQTLLIIVIGLALMVAIPAGLIILAIKLWKRLRDGSQGIR